MQAGIMTKILDDIVTGGDTVATQSHIHLLHKPHFANSKTEPVETDIFPATQTDIARTADNVDAQVLTDYQ